MKTLTEKILDLLAGSPITLTKEEMEALVIVIELYFQLDQYEELALRGYNFSKEIEELREKLIIKVKELGLEGLYTIDWFHLVN